MGLLDGILGAALGNQQGGVQGALLQAVIGMMTNQQGGNGSSSGLGGILGGLLSGNQQQGGLGDMLGGLLGGGQDAQSQVAGGLGNLTGLLSQLGLGQQVDSWVGTGENQAISADDIHNTLGQNGMLSQLAQQAGLSEQDAAGGLAQLLPNLINQLTPNGKIDASDIGSVLGQFLGK
ncbi:YidB family protein [Hydromonas duriensis]|uniref:Uncharacterized protein YidB (DUF937 family) n=1 Tax=Hydromonas duriensis TaxID=1527608 RepID=A0A4R6YBI8_9BURK|nr:YidB family protein [Hydromonas duriensis]TDR32959.1 uncharacterized protein YidB (DUF937 family) [Hydromonas duriensis]